MKKTSAILISIFFSFGSIAQNMILSVNSGYTFITHDRDNYSSVSKIPLVISLGLGHRNLQFGADLALNLVPQTFIFYDAFTEQERVKEEIEEKFVGGFIRYNSSYEPSYNAGFIVKVGAGINNSNKIIIAEPDGITTSNLKYEPAFQLNCDLGVSIPISGIFHSYIGYGFRTVKKELVFNGVVVENFKQLSHSIQLGLSLNIDF